MQTEHVEQSKTYFTNKEMLELKKTLNFISRLNVEQCAIIVNEVLMFHPFMAFNPNTSCLEQIKSVSVNGSCIQLNIEKYEVKNERL